MKKIYMILAVFALLSLSLNAQLLPYKAVGKDVCQDKGKPASTAGLFRAPAKINTADGEFLVGPYTTDDFSTTGKGLYSTTGSGRVEVSTVIPRADIEQYIGQEIVGYRFATVGGTVSCYSFLVEGEGPNYYINDLYYWNIQSDGSYYDLSGNQWHEYYLDEPVVFQVPDTTQAIWIGYKYYQESSNNGSYTMTPIAVNPNVTSYDCYAYSYGNSAFYDVTSTLGGAVAAQLIFKAPSTDPKITASPTSVSMSTTPGETKTETITVTGANLTTGITATISGTDAALFSVSPASLGTSGGELTISYSPTADGNHTATLTLSSTGAQDVIITLNGTCSSDVTICEGTNTNEYLPIYGLYIDDYQINQMIYPESELTDLVGKNLTSMTFYATAALDAKLSSVGWNVKLGTTTQTAFASSLSSITRLVPDDVTTVAEGYVITSGINTMTITFTTPFTYNGGNLLIDFQSTAEGQYKSTSFYGVNQSTYTGYNSYRSSTSDPNQNGHYSSGGVRQFLPKVTFTFEDNNKTATPTLSMVDNGDGTYTITATATAPDTDAAVTLNVTGYQPVTGTGSASITITQTNEAQPVTATATAQAVDKPVSNVASENYTVPALPITPTPSITYVVNGDNVVITATGQGEVTLNVTGQEPVTGNGSVSITVPRTDETYTVTATATAQATNHQPSATETQQITVPFLQTEKPNITYVVNDESVVITATGDGTVTLNVPGYAPVSGEGSASITVPCGINSTTLNVTATAKEEGKAESETETAQVPIPAATGWTQMLGEYNNPNDLLSFQIKVGNDTLDIMMIDQFLASTLKNNHPDGYTYVMKETVNNEEKSSNEVRIPVYKTDSKMQGFYTKGQVDTLDLKMGLRAQVINSEMCNDVEPDRNTLYHSLYRSNLNGDYPVIDVPHRVSQLQKYEENDGNNIHYFFTEMHTSGVTPKNDHIGSQIVERLDTNYVQGVKEDSLAYVPVIWTFGLYSGREDGKNNSYGSDIKREYLGGVTATITGEKSDYSDYGMWTANGVDFCVYTPVITIIGEPPAVKVDNDGDVSTYVPYMYRAWCLYEGAHDFTRNSNGQLIDNGVMTAPILLDERVSTETGEILGGPWTQGMGRLPWAFGIPVSEDGSNVTFAIRFYYKKTVTEAGQGEPNSLRDGEEGEEYYIVECEGDAQSITTAINELFNGRVPVETIYYNSVGMQSDKPFDGINIVVTRYSDGTTSTSKIVR